MNLETLTRTPASDRQRLTLRERDFESFFEAPFEAYGPNSPYVSPMKPDLKRFLSDANPLFQPNKRYTYFSVLRDGRPVGRITAHIHEKSNERHGWNRAYFGYFDCVYDLEVARMLLDAAEGWARAQGCDEIIGNFNLTAMQQIGVVTDGFDSTPYLDQAYNPPYVPKLLEALGYTATFPMTTFEVEVEAVDAEKLLKPAEKEFFEQNDLQWKNIRTRGFEKSLTDTLEILNAGFAQNPMFVPLTREEFFFQAKDMMWIVDERINSIVYQKGRDGKPDECVAVTVCIPDLNPLLRATRSRLTPLTPLQYLAFRRKRERAIIIFGSVRPDFQGKALGPAMVYQMITSLKKAGYKRLGITWIADVNRASLRVMEKMGARKLHRAHLFAKPLTATPSPTIGGHA